MTVEVGFGLHPDREYLDRCQTLFAEADYLEVAPETTWFESEAGAELRPNGFHRRFLELAELFDRPFVAHGVGLSIGSFDERSEARRERWLERLRRDQEEFRYRWYTDHFGASSLAGQAVTLPLPIPYTDERAQRVTRTLEQMRSVTPEVGVENSVFYFTVGDPMEEPRFLNRVLSAEGTHLLLDLHNVWTMAQNFGFSASAWLEQIDLDNVIEIHVSGGSDSHPQWLASGRVFRLDSHDDTTPEPVFQLLREWAPRCRNLRGITLERMEGTVHSLDDVKQLHRELDRVREVAEAL